MLTHSESTPTSIASQHSHAEYTQRFEHRLRALISRDDSPRTRAARRTIASLAALAQGRERGGDCLAELSVSYVATGAGVGMHSARAGLRDVLRAIGHAVLKPAQARAAGFALRSIGAGRRGPLRLLTVEAVEALRNVRDDIGDDRPIGTWQRLPHDTLTARGFLPCEHVRGRNARCPHHDDRDPSLRIFGSGESGPGYCHGCGSSMHWTTATDGSIWTRPTTRKPDTPGSILPFGAPIESVERRVCVKPPSVVGGVRPGSTIGARAFIELAGVSAGYVAGKKRARGLQRAWARPVLESLVWADRSGPAAERAAYAASHAVNRGAEPCDALPDRFLSVSPMQATSIALRRVPGDGPDARRSMAIPKVLRPFSQEWVLVDIDDLEPTFNDWREISTHRIARGIQGDPMLTGRCAIVETSPTGVQVWAELAEVQANPAQWWRETSTRDWYSALAARVLSALRVCGRNGGHVDVTAASPGRYGRRPGWRLVDGLWPFRVRLLACVEDSARGIETPAEIRRRWLRRV